MKLLIILLTFFYAPGKGFAFDASFAQQTSFAQEANVAEALSLAQQRALKKINPSQKTAKAGERLHATSNEILSSRTQGLKAAPPSQKEKQEVTKLLRLPLEQRKMSLRRYGPRAFVVLKEFVYSPRLPMPIRWKALTSLARLYPTRSLPTVVWALKSPVWFLKNAGLISMEIIDPKRSLKWAGLFLNNPSLVLRTAAVDLIKRQKGHQYKSALLEKLKAPDSFYHGQSLWIRAHIVSALTELCEPGEEQLFLALLKDADKRLHPYALYALEKLKKQVAQNASP